MDEPQDGQEVPETTPPPPAKGRPRWLLPVVIVVALGCAFLGYKLVAKKGHKIAGSVSILTLDGVGVSSNGPTCTGVDAFADLTPGTQVLVMNDAGKVIASASLGTGKPSVNKDSCTFPFSLSLPRSSFYRFQVGDGSRGVVTYSLADVEKAHYRVDISVGSDFPP
jgi:hypothetical protein